MIPVGAGWTVRPLDHHGPYRCTRVALDLLRQAPGRLAQLCRTVAWCKDAHTQPVELWPNGIMATVLSPVHVLSLCRALRWLSVLELALELAGST